MATGLGFTGVALLLLWARALDAAFIAYGATALLAMLLSTWRATAGRMASSPLRALLAAGAAGLLAAIVAGSTEIRLDRLRSAWPEISRAQAEELAAELATGLDALIRRGSAAAQAAATLADEPDADALFAELAELQARSGLAAVAVFDPLGEPVAWAGQHRGLLPDRVRSGGRSILYGDGPLVSYLYFSAPIEESGGHAVAIALLDLTPLESAQAERVFAGSFQERTGAEVRFGPGAGAGAQWSFTGLGGQPTFHAHLTAPDRAAERAAIIALGRRIVLGMLALSLLLLIATWIRSVSGQKRYVVPLLALSGFVLLAPVAAVLPVQPLFSPGYFLLPLPFDLTLGPLLAVLLPIAALATAWRPRILRGKTFVLSIAAGAVAVGVGFAVALDLLLEATGAPLRQSDRYYWGGLQPAAVLLLTVIAGLAMPRLRLRGGARESVPGGSRWALVATGFAFSAIFGIALMLRWQARQAAVDSGIVGPELWTAALWVVPFATIAVGLGSRRATAGRLLRTVCAGWLAATFVLPQLWIVRIGTELAMAERVVATLGRRAATDPYVAYLLSRFADELQRRDAAGERGIDLLYRAWVGSGLAGEGFPLQLVLWTPQTEPTIALDLAGAPDPIPLDSITERQLTSMIARALASGVPQLRVDPEIPGANQALAVPLTDGFALTALAPPRRALELAPALQAYLGLSPATDAELTLVQSTESPTGFEPAEEMHWFRAEQGWRSDTLVRYPEGLYHADLDLRVSPIGVRLARAALLLALDLALLTMLWAVGRAAAGAWRRPPGGWFGWLRGFRPRVTIALFAFFLLPTAAFGLLAYRALAGESVRSTRAQAERAVRDAVGAWEEAPGNWRQIAERANEEVLYYAGGELGAASSSEAYWLGLYGLWMPPSAYLMLEMTEEIATAQVRRIGDRLHVMAFHALPAAGTLAVPMAVPRGDAGARQRELTHLILFAALLGALLSFWLSIYVARALARPIGQLRRAAASVGGGRLDVRLPEDRQDEFGELFGSFNRMTRRLRRARSREIRTARILAWGEMARQVAHEIKNPLTPIKLSVQHLRRAYADRRADFEHILDSNVDHVLSEIDRLGEIARAFSRFGAPPQATGPLEIVDAAAVIRETLALYRSGETAIRYEADCEDAVPPVRARTAELKEVLVNLIENARAALVGAGRIRISARRLEDGQAGAAVEIAVSDDGTGIPADLLPRVFEPHFSTRTAGTGLGLAIVRRLVEAWGGQVTAESVAERGTTVRLRLQAADDGPRPN
ncbi:MAG: sensor histidine kinase [Longimicrobiales bacterium]